MLLSHKDVHKCKPEFRFRVLVEHVADGYLATCLDWYIVAKGATPDAAVSEMQSLMQTQWDFASEHKCTDRVWHPAPKELWDRYYAATSKWKTRPKADVVYA